MSLRSLLGIRVLGAAVVGLLLVGLLFTVGEGDEPRTLTAHFPRAVSVYKGSDVRILGVNVGKVTAVSPEGESVRVEMEYDAKYNVPADAQAMIITPTLVADRFVQLTPVYTEGAVMADGGDIALPDTGVPIELDRIYGALRDLTRTLGPNGANADGTLNDLLVSGAKGLDGQGQRANDMIRNLSQAAATFGAGSGDLFDTVTQLAEFTSTLAENDEVVRSFIRQLAGVSSQLAGERVELQRVLSSVARTVGTVESFVRDNREALVTDVEKLTRVVKNINSEKESIDTALAVAPVAIGNLVLAYNTESGSIGSRINNGPNADDSDGFLCAVVQQSDLPEVSKNLACEIFESILEPATGEVPFFPPPGRESSDQPSPGARSRSGVDVNQLQRTYTSEQGSGLSQLLGGVE